MEIELGETPTSSDGSGIRCIRISSDGETVASGDRQGNLRIHDLHSLSCVQFKEAHDAEILSLDYSRSLGNHQSLEEKAAIPYKRKSFLSHFSVICSLSLLISR